MVGVLGQAALGPGPIGVTVDEGATGVTVLTHVTPGGNFHLLFECAPVVTIGTERRNGR